MKGITINLHS